MRKGMALSRTYDLMIGKPQTPTNGEWARQIVHTNRGLNVKRGVTRRSLGSLSMRCIMGLKEWTDQCAPESRSRGAVKVPYETLYRTLRRMNKPDAAEA